jgi:uncharacterized protein YggL (DUF469 family)
MTAACPELGFAITLECTDASARATVRDAFVAFAESRGLSAAGGGDAVQRYVVRRDGGQAIDADREAAAAWAAARPALVRATVGPLVDLREAAE